MKSSRIPSRLIIAGAVAAMLPLTAVIAQTAPQGNPPASEPSQTPKQGASFESLDTDGDGRISKTEAAANSDVTAQFSRYDQNGDGYIERAEVNSANNPPPDAKQQ